VFDIDEIIAQCGGEQAHDLVRLNAIWRGRDVEAFRRQPRVYSCLAARALKLAEPLLACDIIREAREQGDDAELRRLYVEALIQCGAHTSAVDLVQLLYADSSEDFATLNLCGRVYKHIGFASAERAKARVYLVKALAFYSEAHARASGFDYTERQARQRAINDTAINLATLSLLVGDRKSAYRYVNEVVRAIGADGTYAKIQDMWAFAMLAECHVIMEDLPKAEELFQKAAAMARLELLSVVTMRRQARFLLRCLERPETELDHVFAVPSVACMTGHLVDPPGASFQRLPAASLGKLRRKIASLIVKRNIEIGFCSGGSGGDLLFAEELLRRKGEVNLVLPFAPEHFRRNLAELSGPGEWLEAFDRVLAQASTVTILSDDMGTDDQAPYLYCAEVVEGLAALRAQALATEQINVTVWDESDADDIRGTAAAVARWRQKGANMQVITTQSIATEPKAARTAARSAGEVISIRDKQEVSAILFADTVGFSRITDRYIPPYVESFIGTVARVIRELGLESAHKNSWGDALFMVFGQLEDAARFSLTLCETLREVSWRQKGLPQGLTFRMALHAGPVYRLTDPITGMPNYYGFHVSQGARIEPITPPGQVYTSENFAALMTARRISGYACDYVGRVIHPKNFGTHPIYNLKRRII
jgi:class 3 adenylate cyclase/tetratricopeptide (TPR) repeat protein